MNFLEHKAQQVRNKIIKLDRALNITNDNAAEIETVDNHTFCQLSTNQCDDNDSQQLHI